MGGDVAHALLSGNTISDMAIKIKHIRDAKGEL